MFPLMSPLDSVQSLSNGRMLTQSVCSFNLSRWCTCLFIYRYLVNSYGQFLDLCIGHKLRDITADQVKTSGLHLWLYLYNCTRSKCSKLGYGFLYAVHLVKETSTLIVMIQLMHVNHYILVIGAGQNLILFPRRYLW